MTHGLLVCMLFFPLKDLRRQKAPKDKTSNSLFVLLMCGCFSSGTTAATKVRKAPVGARMFSILVSRLIYQPSRG